MRKPPSVASRYLLTSRRLIGEGQGIYRFLAREVGEKRFFSFHRLTYRREREKQKASDKNSHYYFVISLKIRNRVADFSLMGRITGYAVSTLPWT
jgi:hypothetical protein